MKKPTKPTTPKPTTTTPTPTTEAHTWEFKPRFRRNAFGWKSQPAVTRVKQAVAEIKKVAKTNPALAAEGAILFLERVSPALERVDSSSGSMGTAVNNAVGALVPIIASAPADAVTRDAWLERLFEAHQADHIPYIEGLGDHWGALCGSKELASAWAERLLGTTRIALSPERNLRGHFEGTAACLSALYRAERFDELIDLLPVRTIWPWKQWTVRAIAARGDMAEALRYAEASRGPWASDHEVDSTCEAILLSAAALDEALIDEAYARYAIGANQHGTYLATFRAITKKYPHKPASEVLADLVKSTPGEEGKWFAAAKDAGLYDDALALATRSPCDPNTLTRAASDYADEQPAFALGAGLLSLHWLVEGYGYEITGFDVAAAYYMTLAAAKRLGSEVEVKERVRVMIAAERADRFVTQVLTKELARVSSAVSAGASPRPPPRGRR